MTALLLLPAIRALGLSGLCGGSGFGIWGFGFEL